jgi:hypothetical protein
MWLNGMVPLTCSLISSFVFAWCFVTRIFLLCRPHRNIWYHMFFQCWFGLMMTMIPGYRKKFCVEQYHCLVNWTPRLLFCYTKEWRLIIWLTNDQYKNDTPFFKTLWTHLTNGLQCMCKACMLCDHVIIFFSCAASQTGCASSCTWISSKDHSCRGMHSIYFSLLCLAMYLLSVIIWTHIKALEYHKLL